MFGNKEKFRQLSWAVTKLEDVLFVAHKETFNIFNSIVQAAVTVGIVL